MSRLTIPSKQQSQVHSTPWNRFIFKFNCCPFSLQFKSQCYLLQSDILHPYEWSKEKNSFNIFFSFNFLRLMVELLFQAWEKRQIKHNNDFFNFIFTWLPSLWRIFHLRRLLLGGLFVKNVKIFFDYFVKVDEK